MQNLPRPLATLLSSQLRPTSLRTFSPVASSSLLPPPSRRHASTSAPAEPTHAEKQKALQDRQLRLMDKAGRIKQNVGSMAGSLPAFANYVRPREWSKVVPAGTPLKGMVSYFWADTKHFITNKVAGNACKKALGKNWAAHFNARALEAYEAVNVAFATGKYAKLTPYAGGSLVDTIKSQRASGFHGLHMSWKLHKVVRQEIACARAQELMKKGETICQITLRFETLQSLEIRNAHGDVLQGDHTKPKLVTEYYCFQRNLWERNEDWKVIKKLQEVLDPLNDPDVQM
ncbi:hypothetical protein RQP46_001088 [Phenoliferia psychrophenolica]